MNQPYRAPAEPERYDTPEMIVARAKARFVDELTVGLKIANARFAKTGEASSYSLSLGALRETLRALRETLRDLRETDK